MSKTQRTMMSFFGAKGSSPAPATPAAPAEAGAKRASVSPATEVTARKRLRPASEAQKGGAEASPVMMSLSKPASEDAPMEEAEAPAQPEGGEPQEEQEEPEGPDENHRAFRGLPEPAWPVDAPVPYLALADVLAAIQAESKRLRIQELLTTFFRQVIRLSPQDLLSCVYLSCNSVAPAFQNVEIGIGDSLLIKAITGATGRTTAAIKAAYETEGDLGSVAQASRANQRMLIQPKPLTVATVLDTLRAVAAVQGGKSQDKKIGLIKKLLVSGRGSEPRYLVRALQGKLRIGLAESTVLVSLAHAVVRTPPRGVEAAVPTSGSLPAAQDAAVAAIKMAYSQCSSYEVLVNALLQAGLEGVVEACALQPGIPVAPMLAKPTKGVSEVLDRFSGIPFTCEYKYDGERAQIHVLPDGSVKVFSRSLEDTSLKYCDVVHNLPHAFRAADSVQSCIIDSEVVAYDRETGRLLPFQILSQRSRKGTTLEELKVRVIIFAFDMLYLNGETLLTEPLETRRAKLRETFQEVEHEFKFAVNLVSTDVEEIGQFLNESIEDCCEGLMIKSLQLDASTYEPSRRCFNWCKLKKDYMDGVADSFDLVPLGAFLGRGKRTGVFGAYLLGCYDPESDEFQSVTKIGTGFSDADLQSLHERLSSTVVASKPMNFNCELTPDVWFEPSEVWEVKAADLSVSPVHKAAFGRVDSNKGIALRFPRFVRLRDDKPVENATSAEQVGEMYLQQSSVSNGASAASSSASALAIDDDEFL